MDPARCLELRQLGNKKFQDGIDMKFAATIRWRRLQDALNYYQDALKSTNNPDDCASLCKNMASTHFRLSQIEIQDDEVRGCHSVCLGIDSALKALEHGSYVKEESWLKGVSQLTLSITQDTLIVLRNSHPDVRLTVLNRLERPFGHINRSGMTFPAAVEIYTELANFHFRKAIKLIEDCDEKQKSKKRRRIPSSSNDDEDNENNDNYSSDEDDDGYSKEESEETKTKRTQEIFSKVKEALHHLEKMNEPLEKAVSYALGDEEEIERINDLKNSYFFQKCLCESTRAIHDGDRMFRQIVQDSEELNHEAVWIIIDKYKEASILTKEVNLENEAISNHRLGRVYNKVLKMEERSHFYFLKAVELAQALYPKIFTSYEWYRESTQAIEDHRAKKLRQEQEAYNKERQPFLEELKKELEDLKTESQKSSQDFIKFIYKTHPPKDITCTMPSLEGDPNMKKVLLVTISHYHPDKMVNFGMKWKVLCEEITKMLTAKYECFK